MKSHKARAMDAAVAAGWQVGNSEWHDPHTHKSYDLFGFIDFLIFRPQSGQTGAVQATSANGGNVAARVKKCLESEMLPIVLSTGWIVEVWGVRDFAVEDGSAILARHFELTDSGRTVTAYEGSEVLDF